MHRKINRLLFFIRDLFLMLLDLLLHVFKRFNRWEAALFAAMIAAPRFVVMPTKTLCRSAKEIAAFTVRGCRALTSPLISDLSPSMNVSNNCLSDQHKQGKIIPQTWSDVLGGGSKIVGFRWVLGGGSKIVGFRWVKEKKKDKVAAADFSWMVVKGHRDAKNAAPIPSVRTLTDSKLGVISIGDRPPWNSIGRKTVKRVKLCITSPQGRREVNAPPVPDLCPGSSTTGAGLLERGMRPRACALRRSETSNS
ncbi:hypothetical protein B296_00006567 [Ensete ventricosum]|uniref:Uncharacterized protein n=1 Tax=Ensete ventricosum TaxID=4639 RepID=A0A427B360_ENSVE|nr:hypothetical protein B296_00006567 [Ensete ventricosum]